MAGWLAQDQALCHEMGREACHTCVIPSPCILLSLTFSLLKLDEDARKSPIILAGKLWPLRLKTSVFPIAGAENFQRASVLASQICLSKDWAMWLPTAPSQAQSSFQRAGHMVPQVPLRFGTQAKNRHLPEGDLFLHQARMKPHYKRSQNLSDWPISVKSRLGQKPWWIIGTHTWTKQAHLYHLQKSDLNYIPDEVQGQVQTRKTRLRRISQRKPCSSMWAPSCVSASSPRSGGVTWFWIMLFIFKQWKDVGTNQGWKENTWTFSEQWSCLEVHLNNSKDWPVIAVLTCSKQHGQKYLELTLPLAGESLIT